MNDTRQIESPPPAKRCTRCGKIKPLDEFPRHAGKPNGREARCKACAAPARRASYLANRDRCIANAVKSAAGARLKVFTHYGTTCACCGTTEQLSIDHIAGGGRQHIKQLGVAAGTAFYFWLIRNDFPDGYQTLCMPCNLSKGQGPRCWINHGANAA